MKHLRPTKTDLCKMILLSVYILLYGCTLSVEPITSIPTTVNSLNAEGGTMVPDTISVPEPSSVTVLDNIATPLASVTPTPSNSPRMMVIPLLLGGDFLGERALYSVYLDGTNLTRLIERPETSIAPQWSPDGARLAFLRFEAIDQSTLYVLEMSSMEVTRCDVSAAQFSWSPDSEMIVFSEYHMFAPPDRNGAILVLSVDDLETRVLFTAEDWGVAGVLWSPTDVNQILTLLRGESENALYIFDLEGGDRKLPTFYMPDPLMGIVWDPIGETIAYHARCDECSQLRIINADGTQDRALTITGQDAIVPRWSPDGGFLAYTTVSLLPGSCKLNILELDSEEIIWSFEPVNNVCRSYNWSPDSKFLAYLTDTDDVSTKGYALNVFSLETREVSQVLSEGVTDLPAWRP